MMKRFLITGVAVAVVVGSIVTPVLAAPANSVFYSKPIAGKCSADSVKVKSPKTQKVTWQWVNGNVGKKKITKGKVVCKSVTLSVPPSEATYNTAGVMTKLPANFPKNPTVADIQSLGLTPQSKVAPNLTVPQPKTPVAEAKLADTVTPLRAWTVERNVYGPFILGQEQQITGTKTVIMVEWKLVGGSGVVNLGVGAEKNNVPQGTVINKDRNEINGGSDSRFVNGVAYVSTGAGTTKDFQHGKFITKLVTSGISPDFGQTSLPTSMTQHWKYNKAVDDTGIGSPTGKRANPAVIRPGSDGIVIVNSDLSIS